MKLSELFEYQLLKSDAGYKIYINPSAKYIRLLLKNSYVLSQLPNVDIEHEIDTLDTMDDEYVHRGGQIHGLDYPLRGVVVDGTVYIVDSYDADHEDLIRALRDQGIETRSVRSIPITIEKSGLAPRNDLEDYAIAASQNHMDTLKSIQTVTRMRMPIIKWN